MRQEEEIIDYEEVKESKDHWMVQFAATVLAGLIALLIVIPTLLLLCFKIDPLGIKAKMKQDEDIHNAQDVN